MYIKAQHEGKILLVDFDDTLSKFQGCPPALPGDPLPGAVEYLSKFKKDGWLIHIFSGRSNYEGGTQQIAEWMDKFQLPYDAILPNKPHYNVLIDDNAISPKEHSWADVYETISSGKIGIQASAPGSKDFDFSSVHVVLPKELGDQLVAWGTQNISSDILDTEEGTNGREDYPHVTIKYGIHNEDPNQVLDLLKNEKPISFKFGKISLFKSEKKPFDVVKVEIISPDLHRLNAKISKNVEVTDTFPEYRPHATIAYIKKGTGDQFEGNIDLEGLEATVSEIEFSSKSKDKGATQIKLSSALRTPECVCRHSPKNHKGWEKDIHPSQVASYLGPCQLTNCTCHQYRPSSVLQADFTPSLVNPPKDKWQEDSDVVIPTKPEFIDDEQTWYFPYKDRNVNWQQVLPAILEPDKKEAGAKELALALGLAVSPAVPGEAPEATTVQYTLPVGWEHYEHFIPEAASQYNVPVDMLTRLLKTENDSGNPRAVNKGTGAFGLAQFMPETAEELGINPQDPKSSIYGAAKYLHALHLQFGNWEDAVRAYNRGPGNVERSIAEDTEDPTETQKYLEKVQPEKESGLQPATTWRTNEPFEPVETNWRLNDNSDNYWQQYSRQYKGLRDNPYWDNLDLIFQFLSNKHDKEDHLLFNTVSAGTDFILVKRLSKKAESQLYQRAKGLIQQLKQSLRQTENISFKAEQFISNLEDQLADADTEEQATRAVLTTIDHLRELGPSLDSIVGMLQKLVHPELPEIKESNLISPKELKATPQDYSGKVILTGPGTLFVPTEIWDDQLESEFDIYGIDHKVYPAAIGFPKEQGGTAKGYTVTFDPDMDDAIEGFLNEQQLELVRAENVQLGKTDKTLPKAPETIKDILTMPPADVQKKRDELLDQMLQLPEGSPERKKLEDKLRAFGKLKNTAETYTDKEMDEITTKNKEDSGDWFKNDPGGGFTPHDWNDNTSDYPQPKDIQFGHPLDQLVPVDRRFDRWITPPTARPPDFLSAPMSSADEVEDYDYTNWKKESSLISFREISAANLIDLIRVNVTDISEDFKEVKGTAHLLGQVLHWEAKLVSTSGSMRVYRINTEEIEKAVEKANLAAPARREQLNMVQERIREQLYAPTSQVTERNVPNDQQLNQMFDSLPSSWWSKESPQHTTLKLDTVKDLLMRNKFDPNYFRTFPSGRNNKYGWDLVGQSLSLIKYQ